jgi:S-adenosylmethionine:tRNA ribosyltransferase-isomerase
MRLDEFDFDLPAERIALRPAVPRDSARMLVVDPASGSTQAGLFVDQTVADLPAWCRPGDLLVFNDTRVIPARLSGVRHRETLRLPVQVTLHKQVDGRTWRAFAKPGRRLRPGDRIVFECHGDGPALSAEITDKSEAGDVGLAFDRANADLMVAIAAHGHMPLPPYIAERRGEDARDDADYQTIYGVNPGAVAAPTAGLHFTPALMDALDRRGVNRCFVTLHVGAGTFLPVKVDHIADHRMHAEWGEVSTETAAAVNATRASGGRIIAVGTTSLRLLESAAGEAGEMTPFRGDTDIFITPGYRFRAVDVLMTNFHLPRSTLFMLVSAFCGLDVMKSAYVTAIERGYRFYSYGDSSLLFRTPPS